MEPSAYPLAWPAGMPRSKKRVRSGFKVELPRALNDLKDALRLFATDTGRPVTGLVISSNVTLGVPRPEDPGVAVYFSWDGLPRCIAVDRYAKTECNVRAIYYVLEARRQEMRHGGLHIVQATFEGFKALPAPDLEPWWVVLGLSPDASPAEVKEAHRRAVREALHDGHRLMALNVARDQALGNDQRKLSG